MRRDSFRLFEQLWLSESITVMNIQITVIVIVNEIQTVASALLAHWIYLVICMCDIVLTISHTLIFILLVFLVKHMLIALIQPHKSFMMSVKCLLLKCLSKINTCYISSWLVDNSADISSFESISDIIVLYVNVFGSFAIWFLPIPFQFVLSCSIDTLDPSGFNGEFASTDLTCDLKNFSVHITNVIALLIPINLVTVELLVLIYCFADIDNTLQCPTVRRAPVWLLHSRYTTNNKSNVPN